MNRKVFSLVDDKEVFIQKCVECFNIKYIWFTGDTHNIFFNISSVDSFSKLHDILLQELNDKNNITFTTGNSYTGNPELVLYNEDEFEAIIMDATQIVIDI